MRSRRSTSVRSPLSTTSSRPIRGRSRRRSRRPGSPACGSRRSTAARAAASLDLCLVVEQFSRACGGMGVAYAVNALGSFPILLGGSEEQKQRWLPGIASGDKLISFGLSEKDAGSDAGSMITKAEKDGDHYVINGEKKWNTGGAVASYQHDLRRDAARARGARHLRVRRRGRHAGLPGRQARGQDGDPLRPRRRDPPRELPRLARPDARRREGQGFTERDDDARSRASRRRRAGAGARPGGVRAGGRVHAASASSSASRSTRSRASSGCSPTWGRRSRPRARSSTTAARAADASAKNISKLSAMCKLFATDVAMMVTTERGPAVRRVRLLQGLSRSRSTCATRRSPRSTKGTNQIQRLVIARSILREAASGRD